MSSAQVPDVVGVYSPSVWTVSTDTQIHSTSPRCLNEWPGLPRLPCWSME